jgi:hypothetical protein
MRNNFGNSFIPDDLNYFLYNLRNEYNLFPLHHSLNYFFNYDFDGFGHFLHGFNIFDCFLDDFHLLQFLLNNNFLFGNDYGFLNFDDAFDDHLFGLEMGFLLDFDYHAFLSLRM